MVWEETKPTSSEREVRVIEGSSYQGKIKVNGEVDFGSS